MDSSFLLVDGHSILFAWEDLRTLHQRDAATARETLVRTLTPIHDTLRRTAVVFDGRGNRTTEETHPSGIRLFYSGGRQSADHVIERLAARLGRKCDVLVATDDRLEQQTVTTFGASCISSAELRDLVRRTAEGIRHSIRKLK